MNLQSASTWANWIIKPERLADIKTLKEDLLIKKVRKALKVKYRVKEEEKKLEYTYQEKAKAAQEQKHKILPKEKWVQMKIEEKFGVLLRGQKKEDKIKLGKYEIKNHNDQSLLLCFCVEKIEEALSRLNYPTSVLSAAITYFK